MSAVVHSVDLGNEYKIVIQDQHEYHGKSFNYRYILPLIKSKVLIVGEPIVKYKVIVLIVLDDGTQGFVSDTNCNTIEEAHAKSDEYAEKYHKLTV